MTRWNGRCRWTPRSPACTSTAPPSARTQGAGSSYTNPCHRLGDLEPPDHAIGRSRGGVTCKIHLATDGKGRPLSLVLTGGNAADTSFFTTVLDTISVRDGRPGRPRTRPDRVLADKAYTAAANRGGQPPLPQRPRHQDHHPRTRGPEGRPCPARPGRWSPPQLRRRGLQGPQRRRTLLQQTQTVARHRHSLRQDRSVLPRRTHPAAALLWTR